MRNLLVFSVVVAAANTMAFAGVSFTAKPAVITDGDSLRVEFAVSERTDVEVAVIDGQGRVLRHMAAGRVGEGLTAAAPLAASLKQSIPWDRKDDAGNPVAGQAAFRVRLGMKASFGRIIGGSPYVGQSTDQHYRGSLPGIAIDDNGNLFVKMMSDVHSHGNSGLWPWQLRQFDPEGNYVKTLLPYPASTEPAKASGVTVLATPDGAFTPAQQNSLYPVTYVFGSVISPYVRDGQVAFVNSRSRVMHLFKVDGSNQLRTVKMWQDDVKPNFPTWLEADVAFSPDNKTVYISGLAGTVYDGKKPEDVDPKWPNGRVYKLDLTDEKASAQPFFDVPLPNFAEQKYWMPSAWDHRCASGGIDVDSDGKVYVGDLVNQQVIIVGADGKQIETIKVPWPDRVRVHPKSGDIYVVERVVSRGNRPPCKIYKITGRGANARIAASLTMKPGNVEMTLDSRGQTPVLWVQATGDGPAGKGLFRVEDRGGELVVVRDAFDRDKNAVAFVGNLNVDRFTNQVYVTNTASVLWRYDGVSGAGGQIKLPASDVAVGSDCLYRIVGWHGGIARFTKGLVPAPPAGEGVKLRPVEQQPGVMEFGSYYGRAGRGCSVAGITLDPQGRLWCLQEGGNVGDHQAMFVKAYNPDGAPIKTDKVISGPSKQEEFPIISGFDNRAGCVRVDRAGNIYVGWGRVLKDHKAPPGFEKDEAYSVANGVILKFGPDGGHRDVTGKGDKVEGTVIGFANVKQVYEGFAPFSAWRCDGSCICAKPRFDIDGFGRLFVPNAITYSVAVMDNAANTLTRFGHYGNFDSQGPGSAQPRPEIPFGWPIGVGVCGDHVYVGDVLNHRIVRVDLSYAATETAVVK